MGSKKCDGNTDTLIGVMSKLEAGMSTASVWSAHTKANRRWMAKTLDAHLQAHVCFIQVSVDSNPDAMDYMEKLGLRRGKSLAEVKELCVQYQ